MPFGQVKNRFTSAIAKFTSLELLNTTSLSLHSEGRGLGISPVRKKKEKKKEPKENCC